MRSLALALALFPAAARAQNADDPTRRRLILQAGALRDRGDHQGALDLARQAAERRMSPSLRLFIAEEERSLGQTVQALHDAQRCAAEFEAPGAIAHREEFLASCRALVEELAPFVGRLIVWVPNSVEPGVRVTIRGEELPRAQWGTPWEVLPGPARIEAVAPSGASFARNATITAGATSSVRVELAAGVRAPPEETHATATTAVVTDTVTPHATTGGGGRSDVGRWALLGGAGALFVGAGVFYALQGSATDDRDAQCAQPTGRCVVRGPNAARAAQDAQDRASTYNTLTNLSLAVGAAAAVGGLIWWIVDLSAPHPRARLATVFAVPAGDGAVVGVQGAL